MGIDAVSPVRPYTRAVQARMQEGGYSEFFRVRGQAGLWPKISSNLALLNGNNPRKVVSVGCSTGEEPYSVAILAHFMGLNPFPRIIGIDINAERIARAREGVYHKRHYIEFPERSIPAQYHDYFRGLSDQQSAIFSVTPGIRTKVDFLCGDLLSPHFLPESTQNADIVLALNLIPGDPEVAMMLHSRAAELLKPKGLLIVNHDSLSLAQLEILSARLRSVSLENSVRVFERAA